MQDLRNEVTPSATICKKSAYLRNEPGISEEKLLESNTMATQIGGLLQPGNDIGDALTPEQALDALLGNQPTPPESLAEQSLDQHIAATISRDRSALSSLEEEYPIDWPPALKPRERLHCIYMAFMMAMGVPDDYISARFGVSAEKMAKYKDEPFFTDLLALEHRNLINADRLDLSELRPLGMDALTSLLRKKHPATVHKWMEMEGLVKNKLATQNNQTTVIMPQTADQIGLRLTELSPEEQEEIDRRIIDAEVVELGSDD